MSGHTPGPWRYDYEQGYCGEIITADGRSVCTFTDEPTADDARLIAAAPDLLEALQELMGCPYDIDEATLPKAGIDAAPNQVVGTMSVALVRRRKALTAIAKATGGEAMNRNDVIRTALPEQNPVVDNVPLEEALKRAYYYDDCGNWRVPETREWDRWHAVARAAITKATGAQNG